MAYMANTGKNISIMANATAPIIAIYGLYGQYWKEHIDHGKCNSSNHSDRARYHITDIACGYQLGQDEYGQKHDKVS